MEDWQAMRERAGLTLEDVARLSEFAVSTINGFEKHGKGSRRLKKKLAEIYREHAKITESEKPIAKPLALRETTPEADLELWRRRAKTAERRLHDLRAALRALVDTDSDPGPKPPPIQNPHSRGFLS